MKVQSNNTGADSAPGCAGKRQGKHQSRYVLVTSAYNEQENIEKTIYSIVSQTLLPERWVIVSDGSTDRTDDIIRNLASTYDFIRFLRISRPPGRSFGAKVTALRNGNALLEGVQFEFIGNMDADVTVTPSYFEELIARFEMRPRLGLGGGYVLEDFGSGFRSRPTNRDYSVAHAAQLVRRECYEVIEGYAVLKYGGEDWHAQISARMKGWEAQAFPELAIFHHRHTGEADNLVRHKFRQGRMDYSFGSDPVFELFKCLRRIPEKPFFVGGIARLMGFTWSAALRERRPVPDEFKEFLRKDQKRKLFSILRRMRKGVPDEAGSVNGHN